ncbi:MAG: hypothetical protein AB7F96_15430 [Beijerinckiaceae bacterium]
MDDQTIDYGAAPSTDLIPALPTEAEALKVFTTEGGVDPYIEHVRKAVAEFKGDVTSKAGREAIASMAHKVATSKTALERIGKALADEQKAIPKKIDAARKRVKDELDAIRDQVRKPLDRWEEADKGRREAHGFRLQTLADLALVSSDNSADDLRERLNKVERIIASGNFEEYADDYTANAQTAIDAINAALDARLKRDQEAAELEKLRKEAAEREAAEKAAREKREAAERAAKAEQERKEREERIAKEAAERAQREAEEARRREAEEAAARLKAEQDAREKAERDAREAEARAERERIEAEVRAKEAAERAERERVEAEVRAKRQAEEAAAAERQRIADEQAREKAEADRRERNKRHRAKVIGEAVAALTEAGIERETADKVIAMIATGIVPHCKMEF